MIVNVLNLRMQKKMLMTCFPYIYPVWKNAIGKQSNLFRCLFFFHVSNRVLLAFKILYSMRIAIDSECWKKTTINTDSYHRRLFSSDVFQTRLHWIPFERSSFFPSSIDEWMNLNERLAAQIRLDVCMVFLIPKKV